MGGKSSKSDVQEQEPWGPQQDFLKFGFNQAKSQFQQPGPGFFPFSTVAPFAPEQLSAMEGIAGRATAGSPLNTMSSDYATRTLNGDFLSPSSNPWLQGVFDDINSKVNPAVTSTFANSGRTGSPLEGINLGTELTRAYSPFAFDAYNQERTRQQQVLSMAPSIANQDYFDMDRLAGVGALRQGQGQAELGDAQARYDFEQNLPYQKLAQFMGLISGNYGGTMSMPSYSNPAAGALGGAAAGAGIGTHIMPGWGTAGGAALGGLLGLFGS